MKKTTSSNIAASQASEDSSTTASASSFGIRQAAGPEGSSRHRGPSRRAALTALGATLLVAPVAACSSSKKKDSAQGSSSKTAAQASTTISQDTQNVADGMAKRIKAHWPSMNTVWPGMDYTRHTLVLLKVDENVVAQAGWAITTEGTRTLKPEEFKDIPAPGPTSYDQLTFEKRPSLVMSFDDETTSDPQKTDANVEDLYHTATHELVHFYYQDSTVRAQGQADGSGGGNNSRTTPYPLDANPRVVRKMIHHRLAQAYKEPEQRDTHLAHAKYWSDMWESKYAEDAGKIRMTDIIEGTARYCENLGAIVTPNLSKEDERKQRIEAIDEDAFIPKSAEAESYELGYVAGLVLDDTTPSWKDKFYDSGQSLVGAALQNVTAQPDTEEKSIREAIDKQTTTLNKEAEDDIAAVDKAAADTSIAYLRLAMGRNGGFSFYRSASYHYKDMEVMLDVNVAPSAGDGLRVQGGTAFIKDGDSEGHFIFPVDKESYSFDNGTLTLKGKIYSGSTKVDHTTESGREIFTVK